MSLKNLIFLFLALILSFGVNAFFPVQKAEKTKFVHFSSFVNVGPSQRMIQIKLEPLNVADQESDEVTLQAQITLPFNFEGPLSYKWALGHQVELISGITEGALRNFKSQTPQTVQIKVKNFSRKHLRHVAFRISGEKEGRTLSADALVASDIEQTFEEVVRNVERLKQEENND